MKNAPKKLSREAKGWWKKIVSNWEMDEAGLMILESALEAFDTMRDAQAIIRNEGMIFQDRFDQKRQHPAVAIERDSKATLLRHWKSLGLDLEPILSPGRPAGR
jgi:P27 family predicted phage terminase small subunit